MHLVREQEGLCGALWVILSSQVEWRSDLAAGSFAFGFLWFG